MNIEARRTYHDLYVALHRVHKDAPDTWNDVQCNYVLTSIMGGRKFAWRVVGITPAALQLWHERPDTMPGIARMAGIVRAHLTPRLETTRRLVAPTDPLSEEEFFDIWLSGNETYLCLKKENRRIAIREVIPIRNPDGDLFSSKRTHPHCGPLECEFLNKLWEARSSSGEDERREPPP